MRLSLNCNHYFIRIVEIFFPAGWGCFAAAASAGIERDKPLVRKPESTRMKLHHALFLTVFVLLVSPALSAPDDTFTFNLPAQPLPAALEAYSQTTGIDVAARSGLVSGRQAPGVQGEMTARAALEQLTAGTGFDFRFSGPNSAAIVEQTAESDGAILNGDTGAADQLAETVFTGAEQIEYLERTAPSTLKLDVPIEDTPQSIVVVPREVIEDQGATSFEDVSAISAASMSPFPSSGASRRRRLSAMDCAPRRSARSISLTSKACRP